MLFIIAAKIMFGICSVTIFNGAKTETFLFCLLICFIVSFLSIKPKFRTNRLILLWVPKTVAKLGDKSRGALTLRASEQRVLSVAETRNFSVVSQKHLRVSRYKCCRALHKVSEVATLGDIEWKCHMRQCNARHVS